MKKFVLFFGIIFLFIGHAAGQDFEEEELQGPGAERLKAMKVAFITNKLSLTPDQSQKFWPLYNKYEAEQREIKVGKRNNKNINLMSDQEVEQFIESRFEMEDQLLNLKRNYFTKFKQVISIRQIAMIEKAEREFKSVLLGEIQKRRRAMQGNK